MIQRSLSRYLGEDGQQPATLPPLPAPSQKSLRLHGAGRETRQNVREIIAFLLPFIFALFPLFGLLLKSNNAPKFRAEEHVPAMVCFVVIPLSHVFYLSKVRTFTSAISFFSNVRLHWVLENCHSKENTAMVAVANTMRDFVKVTVFLMTNAMATASILTTFAYSVFGHCGRGSLFECDSARLYVLAQLTALIVHFFFIFIHMLMATRFAVHVEFMLNTRELNGRRIKPDAAAMVLSKANVYYAVGMRQTYFTIPLFAWLMGPWVLVAVSIFYLYFIHYVETIDTIMHHANVEANRRRGHHALHLAEMGIKGPQALLQNAQARFGNLRSGQRGTVARGHGVEGGDSGKPSGGGGGGGDGDGNGGSDQRVGGNSGTEGPSAGGTTSPRRPPQHQQQQMSHEGYRRLSDDDAPVSSGGGAIAETDHGGAKGSRPLGSEKTRLQVYRGSV